MACAYRVLHGDALGTVFAGFGISTFQFPAPYFYYEQCSPDEAPTVCTSKKPIPDIDLIEPGWWMEIPGAVTDPATAPGAFQDVEKLFQEYYPRVAYPFIDEADLAAVAAELLEAGSDRAKAIDVSGTLIGAAL